MKRTLLTIGGATQSIKVQRLLRRSGIQSELVKINSAKNRKGCTHGIEIDSADMYSAARILRDASISYSVHNEKENDLP